MTTSVSQPLDPDACAAADDQIYAAHENDPRPNALFDEHGNRLPLSATDPSQEALREEWRQYYVAHEAGAADEGECDDGEDVEDPVHECPDDDKGALFVTVTELDSGSPVEGAQVSIAGPENRIGTTDAEGNVLFDALTEGYYQIDSDRDKFTKAPGTAEADVPAQTTSTAETVLECEAQLHVIRDDDDDMAVDASAPEVDFVRFGIWDEGYDAAGAVKNGTAEADNFVGADHRRFYFRVIDPSAPGSTVTIDWKTLNAGGGDLDAPGDTTLTLEETPPGSKCYVSRAVMLVTDDTDRDQPTDTGYAVPRPEAGVAARGDANHRLRKAHIDGKVHAEYTPAIGGVLLKTQKPVFKRAPDERRRISMKVINYGSHATEAYIDAQFQHANDRWNQVGLQVDREATVDRAVPAAALDGAGNYPGACDNAFEVAALADLIPLAADSTLTIVFCKLTGANAYATVGQRHNSALGDRALIFINHALALTNETLAHELAHVLYNRFDTAMAQRYFVFNTKPPTSFGVPLPDVGVYRRIPNQHAADPDNDAANANILNWHKRSRGARFPIGSPGDSAATNTTGNPFVTAY